MKKIIILLSLFLLVSCSMQNKTSVEPVKDNARVMYQIFVGSFSDSNKDGIGDLKGIINRLDYLDDSLGVEGLWLSPIFVSPSYHKYDATDYYTIDPSFGTLDDLKELIDKAHERNMIVILDLAINHTSTENEWFKNFSKAHQDNDLDSEWYDFYTYVNKDEIPADRTFYPIEGTEQYYEGNFSSGMPELNYDCSAVREKTFEIAKYYLDMGIDGFRFDAAKYIYLNDDSSNIDFWKEYTDKLRCIKEDIFLVGECWSADSEVVNYVTTLDCFNFTMAQPEGVIACAAKGGNINTYTRYVASYNDLIKQKNSNALMMSFIANHDMDRAAGYLSISDKSAYMAANLLVLLPGSIFIYYGEEIGMKGVRGASNTDANRRLAMLWGDEDTVCDPVGATFDSAKQINGTVSQQLKDKNSLLNYYAKLIQFRDLYPAIRLGDYESIDLEEKNIGGFKITYNNETYYLIHNNSKNKITITVGYKQIVDSIGQGNGSLKSGTLIVDGYTSVLLK